MKKEKWLKMFKENLVEWEFKEKEKLVQRGREKYTFLEKKMIEDWREDVKFLSLLVKRNARFATIIDLSGITLPSSANAREESIVYTTSIVVNRNYLNNVFNNVEDFKRYTGAFLGTEKILMIRVIRNRRKSPELFNLDRDTHNYLLVEYKDFFNMKTLNKLVEIKNGGVKIFLIVEGIGLTVLKIIFKSFGIVISSGKNNLKGSLSPTQFNLSRLMLSIFNTSAYKIITQSFYDIDKFVSKPVMDLTERNLELFIKTIIIDENNLFCFIHSSLNKYKKLKNEINLLLMEKDIEKINKYIKENPSKFVEVNNRNVNKLNSVTHMSKRGIHTSTNMVNTSTNKLVINSNNNFVFGDNKCILFIKLNDHIPEVIKILNDGYYTFHFYSYIENMNKKDSFILKDNNELLILGKDNSSYNSWLSLILNKDISDKYSSDECLTSEVFGILSDRISYFSDSAINSINIDPENINTLVITKVNELEFKKYKNKTNKFVYDLSSYSFMVEDKTISIYNPITNVNHNAGVNSRKLSTTHSIEKVCGKDISKLSTSCFKSGSKRLYSSLVNKKSNYVLFKEIKNILGNNPFNNDTQKKIEKLCIDNNILKLRKDGIEVYDVIGRLNKDFKEELFRCDKELTCLIKNFKNRKLFDLYKSKQLTKKEIPFFYLSKILEAVPVEYVVSIMIGKSLKIMNSSNQNDINTAKVFIDLGEYLINHYYFVLYSNKNKEMKDSTCYKFKYNMWDWRQENKELLSKFDNVITHGIGALLVDWLRDVDLLELSVVKNLKEVTQNISVLFPTKKMKSIYSLTNPLVLPNNIPMIVKPKQYEREMLDTENTREELGGYLLNGEYYSNEIIIKNWRSKEMSKIENVNSIYRTINNMSSVAYKINKNVLDFIRLNDSILDLTMLNVSHPLEKKIEKKEKLLKWEKVELEKFMSKKFVQENVIGLAELLEHVAEFYIPVRMDYRGRIYCEADYLNYQGTDLAKSLLAFAKGEKILKSDKDSINYLKIFGANCYGNKLDKKSFRERLQWVDENFYDIRNFNNGVLISKAESKFMFISFCFEFNRWLDCLDDSNSTHFITNLPIQLDASCNGYQHISMLVQDYDLAKHLNLTKSSIDDIPDDFYSFVAGYLDSYYKYKLNSGNISNVDKESIKRLKTLNIQRNIIKKAIMTIPYNASSIQLIKYLQEPFEFDEMETKLNNKDIYEDNSYELDSSDIFYSDGEDTDNIDRYGKNKKQIWYKHRNNINIKLESRDFINLYRGLSYVLENIFPCLNKLSKYFKDIATICTKLGISIPWYLPTGLVAHQSYMKVKELRVKPLNFSKNSFSLRIPVRDEFDKEKQIRALMPNLIHSLDSTSLVLLIDKYFNDHKSEFKNIYAIHDCFAVTCNNMGYIIDTLKIVYINLYTDKGYLIKLNAGLIKHIKNHIGDAFSEKDLVILLDNSKPMKYPDIEKVLKHTYNIELLKESSYIVN